MLLFVVDHDLTRSEFDPLAALARQGKRSIIVLNKQDRFVDADREAILSKLRERLSGIVPADDIVAVAAAPRPVEVRHTNPDGTVETVEEPQPPELADLQDRIVRLLKREGESLARRQPAPEGPSRQPRGPGLSHHGSAVSRRKRSSRSFSGSPPPPSSRTRSPPST